MESIIPQCTRECTRLDFGKLREDAPKVLRIENRCRIIMSETDVEKLAVLFVLDLLPGEAYDEHCKDVLERPETTNKIEGHSGHPGIRK